MLGEYKNILNLPFEVFQQPNFQTHFQNLQGMLVVFTSDSFNDNKCSYSNTCNNLLNKISNFYLKYIQSDPNNLQ